MPLALVLKNIEYTLQWVKPPYQYPLLFPTFLFGHLYLFVKIERYGLFRIIVTSLQPSQSTASRTRISPITPKSMPGDSPQRDTVRMDACGTNTDPHVKKRPVKGGSPF